MQRLTVLFGWTCFWYNLGFFVLPGVIGGVGGVEGAGGDNEGAEEKDEGV